MVKLSKPFYLKKATKMTSTENLEALVVEESLWSSFAAKFPQFASRSSLSEVVLLQRDKLHHSKWYYPQLGIQRPVSDVNKAKSFQPKAIKII